MSSVESYRAQGAVHTSLGRKVGWKEIYPTQRRLNGVSRGFNNTFQVGGNGSEKSAKRVFDNYNSNACIIPILKVLLKSHKPLRPDGNPQMRPVVGAYNCMTSKASEALCDVIGGMLVKHPSAGEESISTEDMLSKLEVAEKQVKQNLYDIHNNCIYNSNSNKYPSNDGVHCTNTPEVGVYISVNNISEEDQDEESSTRKRCERSKKQETGNKENSVGKRFQQVNSKKEHKISIGLNNEPVLPWVEKASQQ